MSNRKKQLLHQDLSLVEVKSKFEAEFRRFSLKRDVCKDYQEFKELLERTHFLQEINFSIYYRHPQDGDLLPINNSENFMFALGTAVPLLRLFLQRGDHSEPGGLAGKRILPFGVNQQAVVNKRLQISTPQDFRRVSQIIDVDILPETVRRVRLCKHNNSDKPLGFYIRDGTSLRMTTEGLERVPGIFISRLVPGGLAGSTGLLSVNDEIIEVNGIEVSGKSLDQVTEMMVANSQNLIVTVKPAHANENANPQPAGASKMEGKGPQLKASPLASSPYALGSNVNEIDSDEDDDEPVIKDGVVHV